MEPDATLVRARDLVSAGGVVIFPTDTLYGIGGRADSPEVAARVLEAKGSPPGRPLPVLLDAVQRLDGLVLAGIMEQVRRLAGLWPGALTLVLPLSEAGQARLGHLAQDRAVGFRIPGHEVARSLAEACSGLLIGTSANLAGELPPMRAEELDPRLLARVDYALTQEEACLGAASTVVALGASVRIIREGAVPGDRIMTLLGEQ